MMLARLALVAAEAYPVGSGRIQGGWEYVCGAYALTWFALAAYALSLWLRRPKSLPKESP